MCRTYQELKISLPPDPSEVKLSWFQKLKINLGIPVYLGKFRRLGWTGDLPFYAYICPDHGLFVSQGYGYDHYLVCPKCYEKRDSPIGGGEASRSDTGVSPIGDEGRVSVNLPDPPLNEGKEASP